ncbi:MAG: TIGR02300 family protein [Hyphomicrobiaceae bacterium]
MATKEARGTKRTCQNPECGSRFYDLNRDPIMCPLCDAEYRLAPVVTEEEPETEAVTEPAVAAPLQGATNEQEAGDGDEVTDDEALVSLEDADAEIEGDSGESDDDTFLEEEDDEGGDVVGIIGPVAEDEDDT